MKTIAINAAVSLFFILCLANRATAQEAEYEVGDWKLATNVDELTRIR
jgi:hypothetical protein